MFDSNSKIVISCAGDNELAQEVFVYLLSNLKHINNKIDDFMTLTVDELEIVDYENKVTGDAIEDRLSHLFKSDAKRFDKFSITRLENMFTIGEKTDLLREMKVCEYCGYMAKDYQDMYGHRLVCAFMGRLGV